MAVKLIAIGSRLMGDDGIALEVAQTLMGRLKPLGVETIIGETDVSYCINQIGEADRIFVLDATKYGIKPGSITFCDLSDIGHLRGKSQLQHDASLIDYLYKYAKEVEAYMIGIEAAVVKLSLELSDALKSQLDSICEEVYKMILNHTTNEYLLC